MPRLDRDRLLSQCATQKIKSRRDHECQRPTVKNQLGSDSDGHGKCLACSPFERPIFEDTIERGPILTG
jgi:hypothetical protein